MEKKMFLLPAMLYFGMSYVNATTTPLIATGSYFNNQTQRPLVALSQDAGENWQFPALANQGPLPQHFLSGTLSADSCQDKTCVAIGSYYDKDMVQIPLLMESNNQGITWHYRDVHHVNNLPPDYQDGWYNSVHCNDKTCIAAGLYHNTHGPQPLLIVRDRQFNKWEYPYAFAQTNLPPDFQEGWFSTTSCGAAVCLVAGNYADQRNQRHPFVLVSFDQGKHWKPPVLQNPSHYPADAISPLFYASACQDSVCLAVGEHTTQGVVKPLLISSHDAGTTWDYPALSLPEDFESGWFQGTACNDHHCIAAGSYSNGNTTLPLLLYSGNKGKTWQPAHPLQDNGEVLHMEDGAYTSAACNANTCMAAGSYDDWEGMHPLIVQTLDQGESWHYPASAMTSVPAAEKGNGFFSELHCIETACIAAGDYTIDGLYLPLLALNKTQSPTWTFPAAIQDTAILPPGFLGGRF